ncbi:hypothetical protein K503DRAFT_560102 [Rhizopogon vinicolor AM-OR11-026]|uniref:F-box domain-containing protein n=1 Tax=Rhizopogon vinicolor AM-OR11-026 TaxID=1314800 RepID=A0A1B7MKA2_9AGAM|nr:hypothetical protein K503DRAFT_560102 [Rhizopogon vinicolor AM-OR11-026]
MRSCGRPLSLAIHWSPNGADKLQRLLQPFTTQISSLTLVSFAEKSFAPQLSFEDLSALQDLTLYWSKVLRDNETDLAQSLSRLPCTLRSLKLRGLVFKPFKWLSTCNGLAQLTHLEITVTLLHELFYLLCLCPNLSSLEISLMFGGAAIQHLEPFTHTNLQSLSFNCRDTVRDPSPDLFDALTLPNLHVLEASYVGVPPHEELQALLARSNCPLECLIFVGVKITDEQRAEYLTFIPSLDIQCCKGKQVTLCHSWMRIFTNICHL